MNKRQIFQSYIDNITQFFGISQSELFSGARDYDSLEQRQLFFYLCNKRGIPVASIQRFLEKNNYNIHHSNILRGIQKMNERIEQSEDYKEIIPRLEVITADVQ
jgi:chromosomal replication initiation ATPase DnaA